MRNKECPIRGRYRRNQNLAGNEISSDVVGSDRYILHLVTATLAELAREFHPDTGEISDCFFLASEKVTARLIKFKLPRIH